MSEDLIPISVWWDINSCPVPTGYDPHLVGPRISSALTDAGYDGHNITAIGNLEHIPDEVLLQINSTGIALRHVQCDYLEDMVKCWLEVQPMCLMLISSHEQLEIFAPTLFKIQPLISSILLAHPGRKEGSEWLWKSFLRSVKRELIWETFLKVSIFFSSLFNVLKTLKVTIRSFVPVPHSRFRPSVHMATTTVLWDIDSCPLPDSFGPSLAGRSIRSALKNSGYLGPVTITAMSNLHLNPRSASLLEALFSSGIHISNIFGYCLSLLFGWRMSAQPPATLMLICDDTTLEMLSEPLFRICDEGFTILVAHPGRKPVSADLWKTFLSVVSRDWIWESFLGGSADDKDEALEYKCREMGYVSCEMCEFSGFSLKDLTTHFSSDEHLEEVSYRNPLDKHSSSTSAGNERETKTEHVGEQETSCAPRGTKRPAAHIGPSDL
ncbi:hypothetical protein HID58_066335 [Brassica napus]|uniref:NYN domain-containing protein n=1 Tax=Brassica napus TaxID=3708 RepID=A0ABQ7ZFF7_BRANA|nr:hypothetical protein HID58_066335 [Brassica napus]